MKCDVLIIGGGAIGCSLSLALANSKLSVVMVEAQPPQTLQSNEFDARTLALSRASQMILQGLGVWPELSASATAINQIHVSKQGLLGRTVLDANKMQLPAFGSVVELSALNTALQQSLPQSEHLKLLCPAKLISLQQQPSFVTATITHQGEPLQIEAKLVVAADGTNSFVRQLLALEIDKTDYQQQALVANIGLRRSHHNIAYERFTKQGLIALLPMTDQRSALVWAGDDDAVQKLMSLTAPAFLAELQQTFGYRLGRFMKVGKRSQFPLSLVKMKQCYQGRVVFVGNASQTLHPVAGQGFNLGLRDVAMLAEMLHQSELNDVESLLKNYSALRNADKSSIIMGTDNLVKFFGHNHFPYDCLQSMSLMGCEYLSPIKNLLVYHATGFSKYNSKLACEIPL